MSTKQSMSGASLSFPLEPVLDLYLPELSRLEWTEDELSGLGWTREYSGLS